VTWPIATDYQEAIQNPRLCFSDMDLKSGVVKEDRFGLPRPISGMFASVYEMSTPTGRWAVRCFLKPVDDHQRRYAAISTHLKSVRLRSAVGFDFIPQGIRIRSAWYPILKMEWIDGEPLNTFIARNVSQPHKLLQLMRDWVELMGSLRAAQIAHGDLQHGNILVTTSGLRLIDYDGMYVPALAGLPSHEDGHRNYQHPSRSGSDFGPYLDNFAAWVIFCSITAVALDPRLWQLVNGGDECLLFRREDFQHPRRSRLFQLLESSRPEVRALAGQFESMLSGPVRQIPALDGKALPQSSIPVALATPTVPIWLSGHVALTSQAEVSSPDALEVNDTPATVTAADWIIQHLIDRQGPLKPIRGHSLVVDRLAFALWLFLAAATGWALAAAKIPLAAGSVLIAAPGGIVAAFLVIRYRRVSGVVERGKTAGLLRASQKLLRQRQLEVKSAELSRNRLITPLEVLKTEFDRLPQTSDGEIQRVNAKLGELRGAFARKRHEFDAEEANALRALEKEMRRQVGLLQIERNALDQQERGTMANAVRLLQEACLQERLLNATIDGAFLSGIGPKLKARLKAHGIFSASDVELRRIRAVGGIGDAKANVLISWKNEIVRQTSAPTSLPRDQVVRIRSEFVARRENVERQIREVEDTERLQRQLIVDKFARVRVNFEEEERRAIDALSAKILEINAAMQRERVRLDHDYRALKEKLAPERRDHEQNIAALNRLLNQQRFQVCRLERELERYTALSPSRYVARILGVRRIVQRSSA
jgi:hypothetical protein